MQSKDEINPPHIETVEEAYERLKLLSLSGQVQNAERLFDTNQMLSYWTDLLKHSLLRKNCEITKLILKRVIASGKIHYEDLQKQVSQITHRVSFDSVEASRLTHRVNNYMNSDEFIQEREKYEKVFAIAKRILHSRTGKPIASPSAFAASSS